MSHLKKRKGITLPAVTNGIVIANSVGSLNTVTNIKIPSGTNIGTVMTYSPYVSNGTVYLTNASNWNIEETPILFDKEEFSSLTKVQIRITSKNLVNIMEFIE